MVVEALKAAFRTQSFVTMDVDRPAAATDDNRPDDGEAKVAERISLKKWNAVALWSWGSCRT